MSEQTTGGQPAETGGPTGSVHAEVAKLGFESRAIHAGYEPDPTTGAVITPLHLSSTFVQDGVGATRQGGYEYARSANPTRTALQECLAALVLVDGKPAGVVTRSDVLAFLGT